MAVNAFVPAISDFLELKVHSSVKGHGFLYTPPAKSHLSSSLMLLNIVLFALLLLAELFPSSSHSIDRGTVSALGIDPLFDFL